MSTRFCFPCGEIKRSLTKVYFAIEHFWPKNNLSTVESTLYKNALAFSRNKWEQQIAGLLLFCAPGRSIDKSFTKRKLKDKCICYRSHDSISLLLNTTNTTFVPDPFDL